MRSRSSLLLVAALAVTSCGSAPPVAKGPGRLVLRVDGNTEHPAACTGIWLHDAEETEFGFDQLDERFSQQRFPDDLRFALQSDGRSGLDAIPALEPGTYQLFQIANDQIANDWETGDPSPLGRTLAITLEGGKTTVLHLEDRLQRMAISIE